MKLISAADLKTILDQHKAFFDRMPGGLRASLKYVDMSGVNLRGRCLAEPT